MREMKSMPGINMLLTIPNMPVTFIRKPGMLTRRIMISFHKDI